MEGRTGEVWANCSYAHHFVLPDRAHDDDVLFVFLEHCIVVDSAHNVLGHFRACGGYPGSAKQTEMNPPKLLVPQKLS